MIVPSGCDLEADLRHMQELTWNAEDTAPGQTSGVGDGIHGLQEENRPPSRPG